MSTTPHSLGAPHALTGRSHGLRAAATDARWVRPALIALLVLTAVAFLWGLSASGYANSFYAAGYGSRDALRAGTARAPR